jgi:hypothetical protein
MKALAARHNTTSTYTQEQKNMQSERLVRFLAKQANRIAEWRSRGEPLKNTSQRRIERLTLSAT